MREHTYSQEELAALVPWPAADANKYTRGKLFVLAGGKRFPGAAALAATAAARMGAGYTEVACAPESVPFVRAASPSLVVRSWEALRESDFPQVKAGRPSACVVGPGFDAADGECARLALMALEAANAPLLVDGGALAALALPAGLRLAHKRRDLGCTTLITPHAGEAARLAEACGAQAADQASLAQELARAYDALVVLKGPVTYVCDGDRLACMNEGTPALAKAGTGDVLAGMIGALVAQGLNAFDAAFLAASLHARAARDAAEELTDICVLPEDVAAHLPQAVKGLAPS